MSAVPQPLLDVEELRALALGDLEAIAREMLGEPNRNSRKHQWRWQGKGAISLELAGRKRGLWTGFDGTPGGDVFTLIQHGLGERNFRRALQWVADRFSVDVRSEPRPRPTIVRRTPEPDPQEVADRARAVGQARQMAQASGPIDGTVAEVYLVEVRKIPRPDAGWPDAIRFHAGSRSLLVVATLADGSVAAIQRVRLKPDGTKVDGTPGFPTKVTHGRLENALVRLPAFRSYADGVVPPLVIVEAPETGLAVWASCGHETAFVLGVSSLSKAVLPTGRRVAFARDDDPRQSPADKAVTKALTAWKRAGADVVVATPWRVRRHDKSDFADTIRTGGVGAVRRRIAAALSPADPTGGGVPIDQARRASDDAIASFFAAAIGFDPGARSGVDANHSDREDVEAEPQGDVLPPVYAVRAGVGTGKSHSSRHYAAAMLTELRARGDKRAIGFAVPTHRLATEQERMFGEVLGAGLTVMVWRGRGADDPASPGHTMCQDLEAVEDVSSVGLDPQIAVCRQKKRGQEPKLCPFFETCAYQAQREQTADVWIVPHELIYAEKPKALGDLAALVVDEAAWADGLEGTGVRIENGEERHSPSLTLSLDALTAADKRPGDGQNPDWLTLQYLRDRALHELQLEPDGPLEGAAFDLTDAECAEARQLEFTRKIEPAVFPGMSRQARREALRAAEENRVMLLRARFWRAMAALRAPDGPVRSGWVSLATVSGENGPQRVLHLKGRREIRKGWQVPTLLIDALLDEALVRPFWPTVEVIASVDATAPHQRVRQVTDRAFAKSRLNPLDERAAEANPDAARARLRNLRQVRDIVAREARRWPDGRVLLVAQKGAKDGLLELGLPRNVDTGHHNAIAGIDQWRDVEQLIVVGRTQPRIRAVERMAEALGGAAVHPAADYDRGAGVRVVAGRGTVPCETTRHPDPIAEAIRWQICEGELVQIIGRGRGVNRSAATPLDVLILTDPPLPITVDAEISAADLDPSLEDRMLGEGGIAFENPGHASEAYPALWATRNTAKTAFQRGQMGSIPNEYLSHRGLNPSAPPLRRVDYQRAGARHSPAVASFDPLLCPDPERLLTDRLGPLAWCRVSPPPQPPPPDPPTAEERAMPASVPPHAHVPTVPGCCDPPLEPAAMLPRASPMAWGSPDLILTMRTAGRGARHLAVDRGGRCVEDLDPRRSCLPPGIVESMRRPTRPSGPGYPVVH